MSRDKFYEIFLMYTLTFRQNPYIIQLLKNSTFIKLKENMRSKKFSEF